MSLTGWDRKVIHTLTPSVTSIQPGHMSVYILKCFLMPFTFNLRTEISTLESVYRIK